MSNPVAQSEMPSEALSAAVEGDGIVTNLFFFLWEYILAQREAQRSARRKGPCLQLPSTLIMEHNFPKAWYSRMDSDDPNTPPTRRLGRDIDASHVLREFLTDTRMADELHELLQGASDGPARRPAASLPMTSTRAASASAGRGIGATTGGDDVSMFTVGNTSARQARHATAAADQLFREHYSGDEIAAVYFSNDRCERRRCVCVEYLDGNGLRELLLRRTHRPNGFVQRWVAPPGPHNAVVQVVWSPTGSVFTRRINRHPHNDTRMPMFERAVTFEGEAAAAHYCKDTELAPHTRVHVEGVCREFAQFMCATHRIALHRLVMHFKVDARNHLWFLWASSSRARATGLVNTLFPFVPHTEIDIVPSRTLQAHAPTQPESGRRVRPQSAVPRQRALRLRHQYFRTASSRGASEDLLDILSENPIVGRGTNAATYIPRKPPASPAAFPGPPVHAAMPAAPPAAAKAHGALGGRERRQSMSRHRSLAPRSSASVAMLVPDEAPVVLARSATALWDFVRAVVRSGVVGDSSAVSATREWLRGLHYECYSRRLASARSNYVVLNDRSRLQVPVPGAALRTATLLRERKACKRVRRPGPCLSYGRGSVDDPPAPIECPPHACAVAWVARLGIALKVHEHRPPSAMDADGEGAEAVAEGEGGNTAEEISSPQDGVGPTPLPSHAPSQRPSMSPLSAPTVVVFSEFTRPHTDAAAALTHAADQELLRPLEAVLQWQCRAWRVVTSNRLLRPVSGPIPSPVNVSLKDIADAQEITA